MKTEHIPVAIYAGAVLVLGLIIASAPLPILLDRIVKDDAFYYFNTARIFAATGFSSFDGIHHTNGYQPLWFLVSVPVFWVLPEQSEMALRVLELIQVGLSVAATALLVRFLAGQFGARNAALAGVIWLIYLQPVMLYGLETALLMLLYVLIIIHYVRLNNEPSPRRFLFLGVLCGLVFLARTDSIFLVTALFLSLALRPRAWRATSRREHLAALLTFAIPAGLISGGYLLSNLLATGHLMPVSGAAKQHISAQLRQAAAHSEGGLAAAYLRNLTWPFQFSDRVVLAGLLGPVVVAFVAPSASQIRMRTLWPFYFGAVVSFLFYALAFHLPYSATTWYYGPHAVLACLSIAGTASKLDEHQPFSQVPGLAVALLSGLVLNAIWNFGALSIIYVVALSGAFLLFARRSALHSRTAVGLLLLVIILIEIAAQVANNNLKYASVWFIAVLILLFIESRDSLRSLPLVRSGAVVALMGALVQGMLIRNTLTAQPGDWNYNLYLGALWARDHLPPDATIWASSAGILGYFSEHTVINTDGLANDHAFYDDVLRAGPGQAEFYLHQWDYGIGVYEEQYAATLAGTCLVPLPPELEQFPLHYGDTALHLQVIQMKADGIVACPVAP
jgi:hypothetical protein